MHTTRTTNRSNYQPKRPKSSGTQGEEAEVIACQDGKINIRFYNVPIKTRFHRSTFLCDLVTEPNQVWTDRFMPLIVGEIQGEFHYKTWGGRPAVKQGQKDLVKRNCLIAEGYRYVECTRKEALRQPELLLDRIMRTWDDEYWFQSAYYREAKAQDLKSCYTSYTGGDSNIKI